MHAQKSEKAKVFKAHCLSAAEKNYKVKLNIVIITVNKVEYLKQEI